MTIDLTNAEAEVLLQLLDSANRAQGLAVADNCLHFQRKIKEAAYSVNMPPTPVIPQNVDIINDNIVKKGKIGTSTPESDRAARAQAVAIALKKAGKSRKK